MGKKVLVTTTSFGALDRKPIEILEQAGLECVLNPFGRRLKEEELARLVPEADFVIAGTEPITAAVMDRAPRLRLISRVGIGVEGVDLGAARERGIVVAYTPDGPSTAVAELTVGLMLSLLRGIPQADASIRKGAWSRVFGRNMSEVTVGVLGVNRVGKLVIRLLSGFGPRILANDIVPDETFGEEIKLEWAEKDRIFREADVITLHLPLTPQTKNLIGRNALDMMKPDALLINTARGGLIDEGVLAEALRAGRIGGAALDVFGEEPYLGELAQLENCLLTSHMGSATRATRRRMEFEAAENVLYFLRGERIPRIVPEQEYLLQRGTAP